MDPEKQDKKNDELDTQETLKTGKDGFKKAKNNFKMIKRLIAAVTALPIIIKFVIIFIVIGVTITFFSSILDWFQSNTVAESASMEVINEDVDIANEGSGYYFRIDKEMLEDYIKQSFEADQDDYRVNELPTNKDLASDKEEEKEKEEKEEYDEDNRKKTKKSLEDWFKVEDFEEYFIKMIRAEIASTYPKLSDYEGSNPDDQGNKRDSDGNYVAQGVIKIHRTFINKDGTQGKEIPMKYLPHEELRALIEEDNPEALEFFSFDFEEKGSDIYYAVYEETSVTVNGVATSGSYDLREEKAPFKQYTTACSMPYNFLFSLLQESKNPNYISKVADLLFDETETNVILMIQDQLDVIANTDVNRQVQRTDTYIVTTQTGGQDLMSPVEQASTPAEAQTSTSTVEQTPVATGQASITTRGQASITTAGQTSTPTGEQASTPAAGQTPAATGEKTSTYTFPAGITQTVVTTKYINSVLIYLQKADTWCLDFEQGVMPDRREAKGAEVIIPHDEAEYAALTYTLSSSTETPISGDSTGLLPPPVNAPITTEDSNNDPDPEPTEEKQDPESGGNGKTETTTTQKEVTEIYLSDELLKYSNKRDRASYRWIVITVRPKRIKYEKFLGLWKNDRGEYYKGCVFDPNGKEVRYEKAEDKRKLEKVVENIQDFQGQTINDLVDLLALHNDTQMHEELMKYYWNKYYEEDTYDVDLESLLDLFNLASYSSAPSEDYISSGIISGGTISGGTIYGDSTSDKIRFALMNEGFSDFAAAGLLGTIVNESGLKANNMQDSYQEQLGMNDESYTAAVDDGSYTNFVNDSVGYGIAQWTDSTRKQGLLNYAKSKGTSIGDIDTQIEYLLAEVGVNNAASKYATYNVLANHGYKPSDWINATSVEDATKAFLWTYGRPSSDPKYAAYVKEDERIASANNYYTQFQTSIPPIMNSGGSNAGSGTVGSNPSSGTVGSNAGSATVGSYTYPHYLQADYSGSYGSSTIKAGGCGPTSLAMILAGLKNDSSITPVSFVNNVKKEWPNGSYWVNGAGSSHCIFSNSFLNKYYGVTSQTYPSQQQALQALDQGYPVLGGETGHFLAIVPVTASEKAQGYRFRILDSARGHDGLYRSVEEANKVVQGNLRFNAIIRP